MAVATFDTLKFANTLKAAGVPDKQAEAQAVAFAEVIQINLKDLVTKDDPAIVTKEIKQEVKDAEQRVNARLGTLAAQIKGDMLLLKWMLGVGVTFGVGVFGLLLRLLFNQGR
ncbi:MAG: CCDC90 family protein [Planctomycetes bacterium]|nr:CCDC90 family protein [Planctomycetota bacterium]